MVSRTQMGVVVVLVGLTAGMLAFVGQAKAARTVTVGRILPDSAKAFLSGACGHYCPDHTNAGLCSGYCHDCDGKSWGDECAVCTDFYVGNIVCASAPTGTCTDGLKIGGCGFKRYGKCGFYLGCWFTGCTDVGEETTDPCDRKFCS